MQRSNAPDLTLRQLQTMVTLADYGSFIATATLMKTSQPAVTRTVHLEAALGVKLCTITGNSGIGMPHQMKVHGGMGSIREGIAASFENRV